MLDEDKLREIFGKPDLLQDLYIRSITKQRATVEEAALFDSSVTLLKSFFEALGYYLEQNEKDLGELRLINSTFGDLPNATDPEDYNNRMQVIQESLKRILLDADRSRYALFIKMLESFRSNINIEDLH